LRTQTANAVQNMKENQKLTSLNAYI